MQPHFQLLSVGHNRENNTPVSLRFYIISFFVLSWTWNFSQQAIAYESYTSDSGLSENVVYCIHQDKRGFIWAGTDYGLNRFDGYTFTQFNQINTDTFSLSNPSIISIREDKLGNFWIGTHGGLNYFNALTGHTQRIHLPEVSLVYAVNNIIEISDGHVVFISSRLIYSYNRHNKTVTQISIPHGHHLTTNKFFDFRDNQYCILLSNENGEGAIGVLDPSTLTFNLKSVKSLFPSIQSVSIDYYETDGFGNTFISTFKDKNFIVIDAEGRQIANISKPFLDKKTPVLITCSAAVNEDTWFGTNHGIFIFDRDDKSLTPHLLAGSNSIPESKEILSIIHDKDGYAWLGTFGEGLMRCLTKPSPFKNITLHEISHDQTDRVIFGLYHLPDDTIAVITTYSNVTLIKNGKVVGSLSNDELTVDRIAFMGSGRPSASISPFQKNILQALLQRYEDPKPEMFLFPSDTVLVESSSELVFYTPTCEKSFPIFMNNLVHDDRYYWIASYNGLHRIDQRTFTDSLYQFDPHNPYSLSNDRIYYIIQDKENNLWMGTKGGGLNHFIKKENKFYRYTTEHGLPDNVVYFILPDGRGNLWLTSNKGISRFNLKDKTFCNYSRRDGLLNSEFNRLGGLISGDGTMYFAGTNGIDYFKAEEIDSLRELKIVHITQLKINEEITSLEESQFNYSQNNVSFFFTANDFIRPDLIYFRYKINNKDEWTRLQGRNFVTFGSLPPGHYNFEVQGSYDNLHWSTSAEKSFHIMPPFWKTWWFMILVLFAIVGLLYAFYRFRIQQIKKIFSVRGKISRDLHDDIGASLSSIHFNSSLAEKEVIENPKKATEILQQINKSSRHVIENISDIIWANTDKKDTSTLAGRIKNYGYDLLSQQNIECRYIIDPQVEKRLSNPEARRNILLIVKEALNNIAKYSQSDFVEIRIAVNGIHLNVDISDNGKGFDINSSAAGNGLVNMEKRTKSLGGKFSIQSAPGKGTSVKCTIPLPNISDT